VGREEVTMQKLIRVLVFSFAALPVVAQTLGDITGEVRDPGGAVIPGAAVTATNSATNATRSTTTNEAGLYSIPSLQPGAYDVRVRMEGFATAVRGAIPLQVQQTVRADFTMQLGDVRQTVEIKAEVGLLDTESVVVGTVIENKRILELPLNGRNFLQLVALTPNVSFGYPASGTAGGRQGGMRTQQTISIAGQRNFSNRYTLDGIENTDVDFGTYLFLPSIDALLEFKVESGILPAEFGRQPSQVNASTKPGTNSFHGALFEFLRNDKLDARPFAFTPVHIAKTPPFKLNQYGFTIGGPVLIPKLLNGKNRLFFMSNFEGLRDRKQQLLVLTVPVASMRNGDFTQFANPIYDPDTRTGPRGSVTAQPFPGNVIPQNRLSATSRQLLEFIPPSNIATSTLFRNYQTALNRVIDRDQFTQRIDWVESTASTWFGRYSWSNEKELSPGPAGAGTKLTSQVKQLATNNTRVFSPTLVNDFRFGYSKFFNSNGTELAFVRDVLSELKIPGFPSSVPSTWGIPTLGIAGVGDFGNGTNGPNDTDNRRIQFVDNLSWIRGKHSMRMGAEILSDDYNVVGNAFIRGVFTFNGTSTQNPAARAGTGSGMADFMLGRMVSNIGVLDLATVGFRAVSQYYYFDDSWKVTPRLTVNLGLRYENTPPFKDKLGRAINVHQPFFDTAANVQDLSRHPTLVRIGKGDFYEGLSSRFNPAIKVARDGRLGERLVYRDNNDFAPRVGVAWSPTSKWTVRSGFAVYYSQEIANARFDIGRNISARREVQGDIDFPNLSFAQPMGASTTTAQINTPGVFGNVPYRRTPYTLQWVFNLQRELIGGTLIEAGYLGSVSHKQEMLVGTNFARPAASGAVQPRRPYPQFGSIQIVENQGNATHNALGIKLQRRFNQGLTYLLSYTFARSIDIVSGLRSNANDVTFPQDTFNPKGDRALSAFHVKNRLAYSTLYEIPIGKGRALLNRGGVSNVVLGGWQIGSIVTVMSGNPMNIRVGRDQSNTGGFNDRPDATGQPMNLPRGERTTSRWFNTKGVVLQPFGQYGNAGRGTVTTPGLMQWDFNVQKTFPLIAERHRLEFRFEAFNFTNNSNFERPGFQLLDADFGVISATRVPMRELQFGLKYVF